MPTQNQTEGFNQTNTGTPGRSPDLMVCYQFIGLYLISPNLAWFIVVYTDTYVIYQSVLERRPMISRFDQCETRNAKLEMEMQNMKCETL